MRACQLRDTTGNTDFFKKKYRAWTLSKKYIYNTIYILRKETFSRRHTPIVFRNNGSFFTQIMQLAIDRFQWFVTRSLLFNCVNIVIVRNMWSYRATIKINKRNREHMLGKR